MLRRQLFADQQDGPQVTAVAGQVVAGAAAIELAPVDEPMGCVEQEGFGGQAARKAWVMAWPGSSR
jgi:hypothetical protein